MIETWYVMEDGSVADPSQVKRDAVGVLRHSDGRAVAMRGDVPRTRSVDLDQIKAKAAAVAAEESAKKKAAAEAASAAKDMKPSEPKRTYQTRESKAD